MHSSLFSRFTGSAAPQPRNRASFPYIVLRITNRTRSHPLLRPAVVCAALVAGAASLSAAATGSGAAGWQAQTFPGIRAIYGARVTHQFAHTGKSCLVAAMDLSGASAARHEGEIYIDMRYHPPRDVQAPVDLSGKTIHVWVYAPAGLAGPAKNPNGIRVFVKDSQWRSEYGTWTHVVPARWTRLTLTPSTTTPANGYRDPGFDPQKIIALGVSVAVGRRSTAHYNGSLEIDDVSWSDQPRYDFEQ